VVKRQKGSSEDVEKAHLESVGCCGVNGAELDIPYRDLPARETGHGPFTVITLRLDLGDTSDLTATTAHLDSQSSTAAHHVTDLIKSKPQETPLFAAATLCGGDLHSSTWRTDRLERAGGSPPPWVLSAKVCQVLSCPCAPSASPWREVWTSQMYVTKPMLLNPCY